MQFPSSLYKEFTPEELGTVVEVLLNTSVKEAHLLSGGAFNTTYFVKTAGCGDVVLRAGPINRHLMMPFEHNMMEAEAMIFDLFRENGIPTSEVLALDLSKRLYDRDYMIVRNIPSHHMRAKELPAEDSARIYRDFGSAVAKIHKITAPRFGRVPDVLRGGGFTRWSECMQKELEDWLSVAMPAKLLEPEDFVRLREVYRDNASLMDEVETPTLVHTDLGWGNVLVSTDTPRPEFAAIIDPDRGMFGDIEWEFCLIDWMLTDDFIEGYGRRPAMDPTTLKRRKLCHLMRRLFDTYVWQEEYHMQEYADHGKKLIRETLTEL